MTKNWFYSDWGTGRGSGSRCRRKTRKSEEERALHEDVMKGPYTSTLVIINITPSTIEASFLEIEGPASEHKRGDQLYRQRYKRSILCIPVGYPPPHKLS